MLFKLFASLIGKDSINRAEGWLSGLRHLIRNQTYGQPYRGFDSHPFRHLTSVLRFFILSCS